MCTSLSCHAQLLTIRHLNGPEYLHAQQPDSYGRQVCPSWSYYFGYATELARWIVVARALVRDGETCESSHSERRRARVVQLLEKRILRSFMFRVEFA